MFETTRFESEQRLPASAALSLGLAAFASMVILIAPGILNDVDIDALLKEMPQAFVGRFGLEQMGTIEGFVAIEFYGYIWLLGMGAYIAYSAAGTIAGDAETERLDTLLAAPISRRRLLVEKYLALLVPIVLANVVVFLVIYVGAILVDYPIAFTDLAVVHAGSIPYFLFCGAVGMLASVAAPRRLVAEGIAAGAVVGTFLIESLVTGTDTSWLGAIAPMRYYDPLSILTASEYDLPGILILSSATLLVLVASALVFEEVDVE